MLFNSFEFILLYLPTTFAGFFFVARFSNRWAAVWLFAASVFFYGWWNPLYVGLLLGSILFNFMVGGAISQSVRDGDNAPRKRLLTFGVGCDLALLAYFKYSNFLVDNASRLLDTAWHLGEVILPLGISFFTFTQIAFLVDAYYGKVKERNLIHYGLFVTYFPHLIAGPVLHHAEMMPQFALRETYTPRWENISVGLTVFAIGLFKKVVLADSVAEFATPVFSAAAHGTPLGMLEAWCGALAYTLQLYFDFSGYSDMAIGVSRMFGIRLPLNFDSPYKATSIIDFWRRWHMTLSRFLRDYLYIPLGGNKLGMARRYANLLATMLLGGLWHGAGWTFVLWGGLHGVYLSFNHAWRKLRATLFGDRRVGVVERTAGAALTFLAVVVAWVFFRASNADSAIGMLHAMTGANGIVVPRNWDFAWYLHAALERLGIANTLALPASNFDPAGTSPYWIVALLAVAWIMPNSQQLLQIYRPALEQPITRSDMPKWRPTLRWSLLMGTMGAVAMLNMSKVSEFLYYQF
jgi:D-alanyl-lipoteichoic acid acyltransferase DltB (MBOAT superfamily)